MMTAMTAIGLYGVLSGIVCGLADLPLEKPGRAVREIPKRGELRGWWASVPESRFVRSFWLTFVGQPGTYLTMWMLAVLMGRSHPGLGLALKINTFLGAFTGLICHVYFCLQPLLCQRLWGKRPAEDVRRVVSVLDKVMLPPMAVGFVTLYLGTTALVAAGILTGALGVSKWFLLCNPVGALLLVAPLRLLGLKTPGLLGVGFALFALVLIAAA